MIIMVIMTIVKIVKIVKIMKIVKIDFQLLEIKNELSVPINQDVEK
jgi:hypothetical protein